MTPALKIARMVIFTCSGPRTIDDRDVIFVYRDEAMGRYCSTTLVLTNGVEVSGLALIAALDQLERRLNNFAA